MPHELKLVGDEKELGAILKEMQVGLTVYMDLDLLVSITEIKRVNIGFFIPQKIQTMYAAHKGSIEVSRICDDSYRFVSVKPGFLDLSISLISPWAYTADKEEGNRVAAKVTTPDSKEVKDLTLRVYSELPRGYF